MKIAWLLFITMFLSCNKEGKYLIDPDALRYCNYKNPEDSNKIKEILIGNWQWTHSESFWGPGNYDVNQYKGLVINFDNENKFISSEPGQENITGSYKLVLIDSTQFYLFTFPVVHPLVGYFFICDNYMAFDGTPTDGSIFVFEKIR